MAAPITKLRIGLQPDTPEEHTRLLINVNTEEAQTSLQIATDLRVRANPPTAKIYYYNFDGSELLYTETIEPGGNGSWDGEPGRASTAQYEFIFNGWSTEPDQVDPTEDATAGVYSSRRVYAAYKRRDISGFIKFEGISSLRSSNNSATWDGVLFISSNSFDWIQWDGTNFQAGDEKTIYLKGSNNSVISQGPSGMFLRTSATAMTHKVSGNMEFLLDFESAIHGDHPQMGDNCFDTLFMGWTDFEFDVSLPATNLAQYCYRNMFRNCWAMTRAPELPATVLADHCYEDMFNDCRALSVAPNLPALELARGAYASMFKSSGIVSAPALPATTMDLSCYANMFEFCLGLITPPELPATTLSKSCYSGMFRSCKNLQALPLLPALEISFSAYANMFYGCEKIKLSETANAEYSLPFRIPEDGSGTGAIAALDSMFAMTGGTFTGTPLINTTYYLAPPAST